MITQTTYGRQDHQEELQKKKKWRPTIFLVVKFYSVCIFFFFHSVQCTKAKVIQTLKQETKEKKEKKQNPKNKTKRHWRARNQEIMQTAGLHPGPEVASARPPAPSHANSAASALPPTLAGCSRSQMVNSLLSTSPWTSHTSSTPSTSFPNLIQVQPQYHGAFSLHTLDAINCVWPAKLLLKQERAYQELLHGWGGLTSGLG